MDAETGFIKTVTFHFHSRNVFLSNSLGKDVHNLLENILLKVPICLIFKCVGYHASCEQ